ncbi:hypothetical protein X777_00296 [Ooceraea biroi]|uniref:Uncharacterized protein n=1 Tax=Ooceraea biroi TaxID=2015173 RepID=A0A026WU01_OOCBI|nr:hypothetical protein X777_00296 [Ooceraea biroi]
MRYSWFIIIANHGPSALDCPPAFSGESDDISTCKRWRNGNSQNHPSSNSPSDSVSQKYENQVSPCSLISIAGRHTRDVTSTRAGGMYSQSVVFPRLAVIQSAKWKDRNGLWFGFRIIHYAAHNTPSPATAVLHTQSRVGIDHTRALHARTGAARLKPTIKITASPQPIHCTITWRIVQVATTIYCIVNARVQCFLVTSVIITTACYSRTEDDTVNLVSGSKTQLCSFLD